MFGFWQMTDEEISSVTGVTSVPMLLSQSPYSHLCMLYWFMTKGARELIEMHPKSHLFAVCAISQVMWSTQRELNITTWSNWSLHSVTLVT